MSTPEQNAQFLVITRAVELMENALPVEQYQVIESGFFVQKEDFDRLMIALMAFKRIIELKKE